MPTGKLVIGMLHLPALPGSARNQWPVGRIEEHLLEEARSLAEAGFDAAIVENFGDMPFFKDQVEPVTVAVMSRLVHAVRREALKLLLGVNVLRNDAVAALSIASATEADFIRVNVHVGATATDQGIVEGRAAETLRLRARLGAKIAIWSDVHVKHGRSLAHPAVTDEAEDAVARGLADAVVVSGRGTGETTSLDDVERVAALALNVPVYVGSGVNEKNVRDYLTVSDGVIVGTSLKRDGVVSRPVDPERARRFVEKARAR